jgi:hypothetical protein
LGDPEHGQEGEGTDCRGQMEVQCQWGPCVG